MGGRLRGPAVTTRRLVLGITSAVLAVAVAVVLTVPASRSTVQQAWCETTRTWCDNVPVGPDGEPDTDGRRLRLSPVDAATWGNYYALGDSYSSGDGAGDYAPGTAVRGGCWRSANAYPERVTGSYDFAGELTFLACSGQRGNKMLESVDETESQLDWVAPHTSLVTIGIGGNDLGFTTVLKTCMMRVPLLESGVCIGQEDAVVNRMGKFEATFEQLIGEVRDRAPDARVLVVGYPRLFPEEPTGMYYTLTAGDQSWLNETIRRFNKQLDDAVQVHDSEIADSGQVGSVEFVDAYDALDGHEIGSEEPWVNGVLLRDFATGVTVDRSTFHPDADGHQAVSALVGAQIDEGPGRPFYVTRATVHNASPEVLAGEAG
ncbi:SGNH/GDSL hydrolase family protein [Actinorugispora endophytica]|uniref:GDSL-like lipase/acylhydrolase family protein n=1 Tax=Actinorugispora endophytica TaxID=1605990 RepID=A0A4R6UNU5_9ACTN|nr:SGNH/GDSL hydrolase family protein [Actinorugispora endophytica]TDQ48820.1 GDSL-like lipase/acylhydrolase family protein [Actinorugispora endophytica]